MSGTCNLCKKFKVPWDGIGKALMQEHLKECKALHPDGGEASSGSEAPYASVDAPELRSDGAATKSLADRIMDGDSVPDGAA